MSIEKSRFKQLIYQELGIQMDDLLDGAHITKHQSEGGKVALRQMYKNLAQLGELADKELDEGTLSPTALEPVKRYIKRALAAVESAAKNWENKELLAAGSVTFGDKAVKMIKTLQDLEKSKEQRTVAALEEEEAETKSRPTGTRPAASVAQQRRAEANAKEQRVQTKKKTRKTRKKVSSSAKNTG